MQMTIEELNKCKSRLRSALDLLTIGYSLTDENRELILSQWFEQTFSVSIDEIEIV
jgi:bifunctional pyridoxal-dependent enzyme with beta-cystathionase and maltose regulon repressor activities